jgi:transcriptional regulator of arginine metabolism
MQRLDRHATIQRLVQERAISTQEELVAALREEGHDAVQATVSRDIRELGLVKVRAPSGRLIYASPGSGDVDRLRAIGAAMRRYALDVQVSGQLVVIITPSGYASPLAQAIDEGRHPAIAGTIAGDNTIFVAVREGNAASSLHAELAGHLTEGAP